MQVRCEYSMANFSTGDRTRRPKGDRFVLSYHFMFLFSYFYLTLRKSCQVQCHNVVPVCLICQFVLHAYGGKLLFCTSVDQYCYTRQTATAVLVAKPKLLYLAQIITCILHKFKVYHVCATKTQK